MAASPKRLWRGQKTGRNPKDRGKQGVKRSLLTDTNGLCVISTANIHDISLVEETFDALQTGKLGVRLYLCPDNGYKAEWLDIELKARLPIFRAEERSHRH